MGKSEAGKELWLSLLRGEELHNLLCYCKGDPAFVTIINSRVSHIYKYFTSVVVNMKWEIVPDVVLGPAVCSLSPLCKNCF